MSSTSSLALGVDIGGSHSRAVLADGRGEVVGRGRGPGANRFSSAGSYREAVATAVATACDAAGDRTVRSAVVGVAGWVAGIEREVARPLADLLGNDPQPQIRVVPDVVSNHAAGSPRSAGVVLAAGTGAIAAQVRDGEVTARADGGGWLLGDEGSAVWIGLVAARAALRALDGRGPDTALVAPVVAALAADLPAGASDETRRAAVVEAGFAIPPAELGRLAPLVAAAADDGDQAAGDILADAAGALATTVRAVTDGDAPEQLVLAGSLLLSVGRLRDEVVSTLGATWPRTAISAGHDGAAGAAWLALANDRAARVTHTTHRRLCSPTSLRA